MGSNFLTQGFLAGWRSIFSSAHTNNFSRSGKRWKDDINSERNRSEGHFSWKKRLYLPSFHCYFLLKNKEFSNAQFIFQSEHSTEFLGNLMTQLLKKDHIENIWHIWTFQTPTNTLFLILSEKWGILLLCQIPNKIIFEILIFLEKKTGEFLNNFLGRKRKNSVLDRKSQKVSFVGYALLTTCCCCR